MKRMIQSLLLSALALPAIASAQGATIYEEHFEGPSPIPAGGQLFATASHAWSKIEPGECDAASGALGFCFPASCNYVGVGAGVSGPQTGQFLVPGDRVVVEFVYRLDLDGGERLRVHLYPWGGPGAVLVADSQQMRIDGEFHLYRAELVLPAADAQWTLAFALSHDAVGNLGRGLLIDDLIVREAAPFTAYCSGDGSLQACPCGPDGAPGAGCVNSTGQGARLGLDGHLSIAAADLRIVASDLPAQRSAVLFAGASSASPAPFGAGLLCVAAPRARSQLAQADDLGVARFEPELAGLAGATAGATLHMQVAYRDVHSACSRGLNLTPAVAFTLEP